MQPIASGHPAIPRGWLLDLSSTVHKLATRTIRTEQTKQI